MFNLKKNQGAVLILALLIMSVVVTVSLGLSLFIISEIKQSGQFDQAIVAYYAAEAGIEKALFQARKDVYDLDQFNNLSETLANGSAYKIYSTDSESVTQGQVETDESFQLDLFNPNALEQPEDIIKSINVIWSGDASLEINWVCRSLGGEIGNNHSLYVPQTGNGQIVELYEELPTNPPSPCYLYRVRIIPRHYEETTSISITAYNVLNPSGCMGPFDDQEVNPVLPPWWGGQDLPAVRLDNQPNFMNKLLTWLKIGKVIAQYFPITPVNPVLPASPFEPIMPVSCQVNLPGRIIIKSNGKYPANANQAARQAIQISMPRREAALPYFDYVLFSEEPVRKE